MSESESGIDKRELILVRLLQVLAGVDGMQTAVRNRVHVSDEACPAAQLFDGDEEYEESQDQAAPRRRPPTVPMLITMHPEINLTLGAPRDEIGSDLNLLRRRTLKAILTDAELRALVGEQGEIRYRGCDSSLHIGRQTVADMGVFVVFRYMLHPQQL